MQIVAHEDDDLLFMNPDLQNSITNGYNNVTVYVTAGEADGNGECQVEYARSERAHNRQRAIKAVYVRMAGLSAPYDSDSLWTRELYVPDPETTWPHTVERYTLNAVPRIQLVFMNLREDGEDYRPSNGPPLGDLFEDPTNTVSTITVVPSCDTFDTCTHSPSCPDVPAQNYTHSQLVTALADIVNVYQPNVVRTLDPLPLSKVGYNSSVCSNGSLYDVCWDNLDHTWVANFTDEVLSNYHGPRSTAHVQVEHYKGYSFVNYPHNLGDSDYNSKFLAGEAYRTTPPTGYVFIPPDTNEQPNYSSGPEDPYYRTMSERYPAGTNWLARSSSGTLVAVSVEDRQVMLWYENSIGGTWTGPVGLGGGGPIAPQISLVKLPDGRLQIFALRVPLGAEHYSPTAPVEVITAVQNAGTMTFGAWASIGSPDAGVYSSAPAVAVDGSGRIFVVARNSDGELAFTVFTAGAWSAWTTPAPGAMDIMEGISAVTRNDGVVEVFATERQGFIQHYVSGGASLTYAPLYGTGFNSLVSSSPTAVVNQNGLLQLIARESTGTQCAGGTGCYGRVLTWVRDGTGVWNGPTILYGDSGIGPVAAIQRENSGHLMLFERNTWNGVSLTLQATPGGAFSTQWNLRGGVIEEYVAGATDGAGRVVFAVKGPNGFLYIQRESAAYAVGDFGDWILVGT